jgi:hypothetical protein
MHTLDPEVLAERVDEILTAFEKQPPKFIVDSYKRHFPWDRPPLELWLGAGKGFKPANDEVLMQVEEQYRKTLAEIVNDPDEIERFEVMKPLRDYVTKNYRIVRSFGAHVLFHRK